MGGREDDAVRTVLLREVARQIGSRVDRDSAAQNLDRQGQARVRDRNAVRPGGELDRIAARRSVRQDGQDPVAPRGVERGGAGRKGDRVVAVGELGEHRDLGAVAIADLDGPLGNGRVILVVVHLVLDDRGDRHAQGEVGVQIVFRRGPEREVVGPRLGAVGADAGIHDVEPGLFGNLLRDDRVRRIGGQDGLFEVLEGDGDDAVRVGVIGLVTDRCDGRQPRVADQVDADCNFAREVVLIRTLERHLHAVPGQVRGDGEGPVVVGGDLRVFVGAGDLGVRGHGRDREAPALAAVDRQLVDAGLVGGNRLAVRAGDGPRHLGGGHDLHDDVKEEGGIVLRLGLQPEGIGAGRQIGLGGDRLVRAVEDEVVDALAHERQGRLGRGADGEDLIRAVAVGELGLVFRHHGGRVHQRGGDRSGDVPRADPHPDGEAGAERDVAVGSAAHPEGDFHRTGGRVVRNGDRVAEDGDLFVLQQLPDLRGGKARLDRAARGRVRRDRDLIALARLGFGGVDAVRKGQLAGFVRHGDRRDDVDRQSGRRLGGPALVDHEVGGDAARLRHVDVQRVGVKVPGDRAGGDAVFHVDRVVDVGRALVGGDLERAVKVVQLGEVDVQRGRAVRRHGRVDLPLVVDRGDFILAHDPQVEQIGPGGTGRVGDLHRQMVGARRLAGRDDDLVAGRVQLDRLDRFAPAVRDGEGHLGVRRVPGEGQDRLDPLRRAGAEVEALVVLAWRERLDGARVGGDPGDPRVVADRDDQRDLAGLEALVGAVKDIGVDARFSVRRNGQRPGGLVEIARLRGGRVEGHLRGVGRALGPGDLHPVGVDEAGIRDLLGDDEVVRAGPGLHAVPGHLHLHRKRRLRHREFDDNRLCLVVAALVGRGALARQRQLIVPRGKPGRQLDEALALGKALLHEVGVPQVGFRLVGGDERGRRKLRAALGVGGDPEVFVLPIGKPVGLVGLAVRRGSDGLVAAVGGRTRHVGHGDRRLVDDDLDRQPRVVVVVGADRRDKVVGLPLREHRQALGNGDDVVLDGDGALAGGQLGNGRRGLHASILAVLVEEEVQLVAARRILIGQMDRRDDVRAVDDLGVSDEIAGDVLQRDRIGVVHLVGKRQLGVGIVARRVIEGDRDEIAAHRIFARQGEDVPLEGGALRQPGRAVRGEGGDAVRAFVAAGERNVKRLFIPCVELGGNFAVHGIRPGGAFRIARAVGKSHAGELRLRDREVDGQRRLQIGVGAGGKQTDGIVARAGRLGDGQPGDPGVARDRNGKAALRDADLIPAEGDRIDRERHVLFRRGRKLEVLVVGELPVGEARRDRLAALIARKRRRQVGVGGLQILEQDRIRDGDRPAQRLRIVIEIHRIGLVRDPSGGQGHVRAVDRRDRVKRSAPGAGRGVQRGRAVRRHLQFGVFREDIAIGSGNAIGKVARGARVNQLVLFRKILAGKAHPVKDLHLLLHGRRAVSALADGVDDGRFAGIHGGGPHRDVPVGVRRPEHLHRDDLAALVVIAAARRGGRARRRLDNVELLADRAVLIFGHGERIAMRPGLAVRSGAEEAPHAKNHPAHKGRFRQVSALDGRPDFRASRVRSRYRAAHRHGQRQDQGQHGRQNPLGLSHLSLTSLKCPLLVRTVRHGGTHPDEKGNASSVQGLQMRSGRTGMPFSPGRNGPRRKGRGRSCALSGRGGTVRGGVHQVSGERHTARNEQQPFLILQRQFSRLFDDFPGVSGQTALNFPLRHPFPSLMLYR